MKRYLVPIVLLVILFFPSCSEKGKTIKETAPVSKISNQLTDAEKAMGLMTPEIMWKFRRVGSIALSPDGSDILFSVTDIAFATEERITNIYKITASGGETTQMTNEGGSSPQWFNEGKSIAFVNNEGNLIVMNADGSDKQTVEGLKDFESFSISPTGKNIYFTRRVKLDQTANEKYNLPNAKVRIIDDLMYRHWDKWSDYSYSHIITASFDGKSISGEKDIMEGQKFESPLAPYFDEAEISWSPDGKFIAYTTKRLKGREDARSTNSDIFLYELATGRELNISEGNRGYDRLPAFSPDGTKIAYQSMERDGYEADLDRLFVYDINSGKRTWVTQGWTYDVQDLNWVDNQTIYFTCAYLGTTQIFKTNISSRGVDKVTEGVHDMGPLCMESGVLVSGLTSMRMAEEISSVDLKTGQVTQITSLNKFIYESINMGKVEEKYIKTKDDKDLQMWIIYPPDFDPSKKYPALLFCEGGPESALGQFWSYRWNFQMMAAKGYVIYAPNRRGVIGFGQEWKEQIAGDWGGKNIQDYLDATDAMAKEPYVDASRMGAVGASYGGFSVYYLAGVHSGRFKAFIAHDGTFDFISEYGTTDELWFVDKDTEGPYWNNPKSYQFSPHLRADNWDTPILIITGANDFRIPYTQAMEAFQAAQLHNIPSKLLFFENETHWVLKPQNSVIWQNEFFNWLETYLK